jgi:hypothetical protein
MGSVAKAAPHPARAVRTNVSVRAVLPQMRSEYQVRRPADSALAWLATGKRQMERVFRTAARIALHVRV